MKTSRRRLWILTTTAVTLAVALPLVRAQTASGRAAPGHMRAAVARVVANLRARFQAVHAEHPFTPAQRQQVVAVLQGHREEVRQQLTARVDSQRALRVATFAAPADEAGIRAAAARLAKVIGDGAVLRSQLAAEIRPLLTADQLAAMRRLQ